ncbi:MAG: energy transducer TonB [Balneolales bacterium]
MPVLEHKKPDADLRRTYILRMELGFIVALLLLITLFRVNMNFGNDMDLTEQEQDIVEMEDIVQTEQIETPPPPPRPPVPVEVPNDEVIEDDNFDLDSDLDMDQPMDLPPPPPPEEDEEEEQEVFQVVENMPEPVGGIESIYNNLEYPDVARRAGIEGRVSVQFTVDVNGNVSDAQVLRGIGGGADEEAISAIQNTEWTPGRQRGRAVPVRFVYTVQFRLSN